MIELIDRRRADDVMTAGIYTSIAAHTVLVMNYREEVLAMAPGGEFALRAWAALSLISCVVCLVALVWGSKPVERAGLTSLSAALIAYGVSELFLFKDAEPPGATTVALTFALSLGMIHQIMKITRSIKSSKKFSAIAEENPALRETIEKEGREVG